MDRERHAMLAVLKRRKHVRWASPTCFKRPLLQRTFALSIAASRLICLHR
jgi:hypothetical protein